MNRTFALIFFLFVVLLAGNYIESATINMYSTIDTFVSNCFYDIPSRSILIVDDGCVEAYGNARSLWGE